MCLFVVSLHPLRTPPALGPSGSFVWVAPDAAVCVCKENEAQDADTVT